MRIHSVCLGVVLATISFGSPRGLAAEQVPSEDPTAKRGDAYFHLMKARMAASRGRGNETVREIQAALELEPKSASLHAQASNLLAQIGRRDDAERMARSALELDPADSVALRTLADLEASRALGSARDPIARADAIRLYGQLLQQPDPEPQIYQIVTNLKLLDGDLPGAIEMARKFAERRPGDAGAAKLLTQLLVQQNRSAEALEEALKFVAANPSSSELGPAVAELAERTEDWATVERALAPRVRAGEGGTDARALMGEALLRQGRAAEAVPVLEGALALARGGSSQEASIRGLFGEALLRIGRSADAVAQLEKALAAGPADPVIRLHLASAYAEVGRLADASATARAMAGDYPGNPGILVVLGETLSQQGLVNQAAEAFSAAIDVTSGREEAMIERRDDLRLRIAILQLSNRDPESAERIVAQLERKERTSALEVRARLALASGHPKDVRALTRKLRLKGEAGVAALLEGEASLREGRVDRAEERFAEAIEILGASGREQASIMAREAGQAGLSEKILVEWRRVEPENPDASFALGRFLERAGRLPEAEPQLRHTLELEPQNAEALNYLGYSLTDRKVRLDEAKSLVERALQIEPWNGAFLDSLGWIYFLSGDYEKARAPLESAAREFPRDAVVLEHLGDLYDKLGETDKAETAWERAIEAGPDNVEELRSKLAKLRGTGGRDSRDRTRRSVSERSIAVPAAPR